MNDSQSKAKGRTAPVSRTLLITIIFIVLVICVVYLLNKFLPFSLESMSQLGLIVNLVTLLTLFRYAYDTYRMADQQRAFNLTPVISHTFAESEWAHGEGEISLILKNYSPFDVRLRLWVDIWYDDKLLKYKSEFDHLAFQGMAKWIMCAKEGAYQGHFKFGKYLLQHNDIADDISSVAEREKHKIIFKLRYETSNNISEQIFKSETYSYQLSILKHPYYNEAAHEYKIKELMTLVPQVI